MKLQELSTLHQQLVTSMDSVHSMAAQQQQLAVEQQATLALVASAAVPRLQAGPALLDAVVQTDARSPSPRVFAHRDRGQGLPAAGAGKTFCTTTLSICSQCIERLLSEPVP